MGGGGLWRMDVQGALRFSDVGRGTTRDCGQCLGFSEV